MKNNLEYMMALDIYLSSLSRHRFNKIYKKIKHDTLRIPVMSWDIYSEVNAKHIFEAQRLRDIAKVEQLAAKFNWQNNMNLMFEKANFEAIIVTDLEQKILWVNDGFSKMTGFTKAETLNKTPRFLQGAKTALRTKQSIRQKLKTNIPFKEVIVNHKKNGKPYKCEVKIFPLYVKDKKTHYLALERQVS
jgi:PAS domain S-box-containing protein